jgi:hypothetical protein
MAAFIWATLTLKSCSIVVGITTGFAPAIFIISC